MPPPIRAACVGAGQRAFGAHYPVVARLTEAVSVEAICELEPTRLTRGGDYFGLPATRRYHDLSRLLAEVRPTLVYAFMGPRLIRSVAEQCFAAGAHVVLEKPPGADLAETEALCRAARAAGRQGIVTFQRRFAAVTIETRRRIAERGPLTLCLLEFHKDMRQLAAAPWGVSTLWEDIVHIVDLARYLCGGAVTAVSAYRDTHGAAWPNSYTALVRFAGGSTAVISGNRSSGGRFLRVEAHGLGLGAYLEDFPRSVRFLADNGSHIEEVTGAALVGQADEPTYNGLLAMHRHFLEAVASGRPALTSLDDALETMRLVERIEQGELAGGER
jgi:virulence factor